MTKQEIETALENLGTWLDKAQSQVKASKTDADAEAQLVQLAQDPAIPAFSQLVQPAISFESFIGRISHGVVSAQQALDGESANYLTKIAGQPHILPSIYRIPKLTAKMRFALQVDQSSGVNLIFFSKRDQLQSQNEQAIDFEVVNVPAPPGSEQQLLATGPLMDLVLDPNLRDQVLKAILAAPTAEGASPLINAVKDATLASRLAVLDFRANMHPPQAARFLTFHAARDSNKSIGLWLLTVPDGAVPSLQTIYKFTAANGPTEVFLRDLILELGDRLQALFS